MKNSDEAPKLERKTVEKNRRTHMKSLLIKLSSLIPKDHKFSSKDNLRQQDYLDQTASYIKHMKEKIEILKQRQPISGVKMPMMEVRHHDSFLEVVLISKQSKGSLFHEVVGVLEEEGAEVINASSSVVGDNVFLAVHFQELYSTVGLNPLNIYERLEGLLACASKDSELYVIFEEGSLLKPTENWKSCEKRRYMSEYEEMVHPFSAEKALHLLRKLGGGDMPWC